MTSWRPGGGHGSRRRKAALLAVSERLYGALLVLYPKSFRRRYASEMRRDFGDLSREGLEEGGATELARVWAASLFDLAVTAAQERGTMLMRNAHLPIAPRIAARLMVAIVLIAVSVALTSLVQTPQYEGSAKILIGQEKNSHKAAPGTQIRELQEVTKTIAEATDSRTIAEKAIERLGLSTTPGAFLKRLNAEPIDNTQFIDVSYTDPDPRRAQLVANTVGEILSRQVSDVNRSANPIIAKVWEQAAVPKEPVSPTPLRNGLVVLVLGLVLIAGLALPAWSTVASGVGGNARQMTRSVGRVTSTAQGTPSRVPVTEAAKEKELLEALRHRGQLTVAGAALETTLSVEEADRMLSTLAAKGHLEVRIEHGRLLYSLWEHDAPP